VLIRSAACARNLGSGERELVCFAHDLALAKSLPAMHFDQMLPAGGAVAAPSATQHVRRRNAPRFPGTIAKGRSSSPA